MNTKFYNFTSKKDKCLKCWHYQMACQGLDKTEEDKCSLYKYDSKAYVRQDRDITYNKPNT